MTINKVSPRNYSQVNAENVERYIIKYLTAIQELCFDDKKRLRDCNKAQLNNIAAELETVHKRLEYLIEGKY